MCFIFVLMRSDAFYIRFDVFVCVVDVFPCIPYFCEILTIANFANLVSISSSSKTPRAAKHTKGCPSKWEYGLPKFQNQL